MLVGLKVPEYPIDLDADPFFVPKGFEVEKHIKGGKLAWNPSGRKPKIELYLSKAQRRGIVQGNKLFEDLERLPDRRVINSNALFYLYENVPQLHRIIPESWKYDELSQLRYIMFWGTWYRYQGDLCVLHLQWNTLLRKWEWGYCWVNNYVNSFYSAALLVEDNSSVQKFE